MVGAVDKLAKAVDDLRIEYSAMAMQLNRHEKWIQQLAEKLASLPISQSNSRAFARLMLAGAMDVELDKQGRVILPEYLRQYAGMRKSIVLAGLYTRLELWDADAWEAYKKATEADASAIAEKLGEMGL